MRGGDVGRNRGKLLALLGVVGVVIVLIVAFSAGGGGSSSSNGNTAATGGGKGTVLNAIFLPATWGTVVKDKMAAMYEKETGVKVNVELIDRDAIHDKMATLFASQDSSYDIFNSDYGWIPEFGGGGHLLPLDDLAKGQDFLPRAVDAASWKGTLYGLPQSVHPALLWYRTDVYGDAKMKAGYKAATGTELEPPKTMEEWGKQVEFFNGKTFAGKKIYGWAAQAARGFGNVHTWLSFLYTYGGRALTDDFKKSTLSTPEGIAATKLWGKLMKFTPPGINDYTFAEVTVAAQQGTIATAIHWSWPGWEVDEPTKSKTVGKWDFIEVPKGPTGESHPHLAYWVNTVSKYSKKQAEAKKFLAWLETKQNDIFQADNGAGDPVRASTYEDQSLLSQDVAGTDGVKRFRRYDDTLAAMKTTIERPRFAQEERWELLVSAPLNAIQLGRISVEDGLRQADEAVDKMVGK
jgi:ABC-type glycerol-3-phosphate transport system substrate-binding protein